MSRAFVLVAGLLWAVGCASTGVSPRPFPVPGAHTPGAVPPAPVAPPDSTAGATSPTSTASATGYAVAGAALSFRGTPYKNGGSDPSGFDCSGLVQYVFSQEGISLPRTVSEQYQSGRPVPLDALQPGDLVFFTTVAPGASHVGIAIGGDEFVHAPSSNGDVRVERLSADYWARRFVGARRDW